MSQGDRDFFYVRAVGVATTFGRAVAALKGVLARETPAVRREVKC